MLKGLIALLPATLGAYLVGTVIATQVILAKVQGLGLPVTLGDRLGASGHDLLGMSSSYLPLLLIAFLIAMPVASQICRLLPRAHAYLFILAGASAVVALHLIMKAVLGLNGVAAVRELHGLLLQGVAGGCGGYLFFVFTGRAHR